MLKIINNCIYHTRGDSGPLAYAPKLNGVLLTNYIATLSVKKSVDDDTYIYQKTFSNGTMFINAADTNNLLPGKYVYDVQVSWTDNDGNKMIRTEGPFDYNLIADVTR